MASLFGARWTGFAALSVCWTAAGLLPRSGGELLPAYALIELVLGDGLNDIDQGTLIKIPLPLRWTAGRGYWRWPGRLADV